MRWATEPVAPDSATSGVEPRGGAGRAAALRTFLPDWVTRDHFGFFVVAAGGMFLLAPRVVVAGARIVDRFVPAVQLALPDPERLPFVPPLLFVSMALALATFFLAPARRLQVLVAAALPVALALGYLDLRSVPVFAAFLLVGFGVARLPIPRAAAGAALVALAVGFLLLTRYLDPGGAAAVTRVAEAHASLVPLLWYSAYEQRPPRRRLGLRKFSLFLSARFFGSPVLTYEDLFSTAKPSHLYRVRLAGVRTMYIALVASIVAAAADRLVASVDAASLSGFPLLGLSYVTYVGTCCRMVVRINVVIGALRLFGVPVRDNFNYWLLARTPNEHWQRWNLLLREWIITYVFFPIMRAKRWLFLAVMAALMTSGALHVVPPMLAGTVTSFDISSGLGYWVVNGFAIYAVIKLPLLFPGAVQRAGIRGGRAWAAAGIALTSTFYAVLFGARYLCGSWADVGQYLGRLVGVSA
jgi:hypothetical protein